MYNISNRPYETKIYETDCMTQVADDIDAVSDEIVSKGGGFVDILVKYNISDIALKRSYQSGFHSDTDDGGFCLRVDLYADDNKTLGVNFHEAIFKFNLVSSFGFTTGTVHDDGMRRLRGNVADMSPTEDNLNTLQLYKKVD